MQLFKAVENSTIYDVCLNTYGTLNLLVKLMVDNNYGGVNLYPYTGQLFTFDETLVANQATAQNIKYATQ